jgi:hypothetical protein
MSGETISHWWVKASDKVYGPYSRAQMARFVGEGRVIGSTMVSNRPQSEWLEARHCQGLRTALHEAKGAFRAKSGTPAEHSAANVLVWAQMNSGSLRRLENELHQLGAMAEIVAGLYMVRTTHTAGTMRNVLSQVLDRGDKVLVLDATRDRLAWFNLGPETDVRLRDVWNANIANAPEPETSVTAGRVNPTAESGFAIQPALL